MVMDAEWRVRSVAVTDHAGDRRLRLLADGGGAWTTGDGTPLPQLDGCIDVDLVATPFTNTLPIRRLGLEPGESAEIKVAYLPLPDLTPFAALAALHRPGAAALALRIAGRQRLHRRDQHRRQRAGAGLSGPVPPRGVTPSQAPDRCRWRKRRTLSVVPQSAIRHQRRLAFLLRS